MKTILINPYPYYASGVEGIVYPPLGLLYLAAAAKKRNLGYVRVIDANVMKMKNEKVIAEIMSYKPDIIGISSNIVTHRSAIELLRLIKQKGMSQLLITGGPFPVLFPEKYLEYCDIVVDGEGEETFCEILDVYRDKEDLFSLKGIFHKNGNSVTRNEAREFIEDLDEIPFPDYQSLKPSIDYYRKYSRTIKIGKLFLSALQ